MESSGNADDDLCRIAKELMQPGHTALSYQERKDIMSAIVCWFQAWVAYLRDVSGGRAYRHGMLEPQRCDELRMRTMLLDVQVATSCGLHFLRTTETKKEGEEA